MNDHTPSLTQPQLTIEEWRDIAGYEGIYQVSNLGNVRSIKSSTHAGIIRKPDRGWGDYPVVTLILKSVRKRHYIHALVCAAFHGPRPPGHNVNHKDANRQNNHADNLEWVTQSENVRHAISLLNLSGPQGERNGQASLKESDVHEIRALYATGNFTQKEIGKMFGVTRVAISAILIGRTWSHI